MTTFWWIMMLCVIVWYSTITIYVAIRGSLDVVHMLRALEEKAGARLDERR